MNKTFSVIFAFVLFMVGCSDEQYKYKTQRYKDVKAQEEADILATQKEQAQLKVQKEQTSNSLVALQIAKIEVTGKSLFVSKCVSCHGADAKTKALGKSEVIAGLNANVLLEDLKGYKAGTLNKHGMGNVMAGITKGLSESDIEKLANFISSL